LFVVTDLFFFYMEVDSVGKFRAVTVITFMDNLIAKIELFYDARAFVQKKGEIFE